MRFLFDLRHTNGNVMKQTPAFSVSLSTGCVQFAEQSCMLACNYVRMNRATLEVRFAKNSTFSSIFLWINEFRGKWGIPLVDQTREAGGLYRIRAVAFPSIHCQKSYVFTFTTFTFAAHNVDRKPILVSLIKIS